MFGRLPITNNLGQSTSYVDQWGTALSTNTTLHYPNGWVKERIGPDGAGTSYTYWSDGQTKTVTDALGNETVYTYDEAGRRASMLDASHRSTWFRHDALGRQVATVFDDGSSVSNVFDDIGHRVAEIDQTGLRTDFGYNVTGLLIGVTKPEVYDPHGGTNASPTWVYDYDTQGRLLTITDPNSNTTTHTFNEFGQQCGRELPMGETASTVYYTNGVHRGQIWQHIDFEDQTTEFFYDDFGRTTGKFYFAENAQDPSMGVLFTYNGIGQLAKVIETHGTDATKTNYPSAAFPPVSGHWRTPWFNAPIQWLMASLAVFLALTILLGGSRKVRPPDVTVRPLEGEACLSRGLFLAQFRRVFIYHRAQRPARSCPLLPALPWRFVSLAMILALVAADPNLHLLWTANAQTLPPSGETRTTTFAYDFEGRLTQVAAPEGTIHYGYDLVTGRHTSTWSDYSRVEYGYDLLGRLQTVRVLKRNGSDANDTTTYTYTPVGSREAVYYPNGLSTQYQYDALNHLTNLTHRAADQSLLANYTYTLGDTGRRTGATEIVLDDDDTTYATNNLAWGYDNLYRLTSETNNGSVVRYEYDVAGSRHKKIAGSTVDYAYNANDQLLSETNGTEVTTYAYDLNGSLTNKTVVGTATNEYAYNLANRLSSVTANGATTSFLYDYQGIRVRSNGGGGQRHFLVDHRNPTGYAQVLEESSSQGSARTRSYVIGDDVLSQCGLSTSNPQWLLYDGHGRSDGVRP